MKHINALPTKAYLDECFSYDPTTGILRWTARPMGHFLSLRVWRMWNTKNSGNVAGNSNGSGYLLVKINKKAFLVHRIIFKLVTGEDPTVLLDHKNTDKQDNRFDNLRQANKFQNASNRGLRIDNKSGVKGVYFHGPTRRYLVKIKSQRKTIHIGLFLDIESAIKARVEAANKFHEEFANHG